MEKEWITTSELLGFLKSHPEDEFTCQLYLGYRLSSTHYWYWDSQERMFMHTRDWPFSPVSEGEILKWYGKCRWRIEL